MLTFKIKVPPSVDEVLQLDSREHVRGYGLDPEKLRHTRRGVIVEATLDQLEHFASFLDYDAIPDGNHGGTRRAAAHSGRKIRAFVKAARAKGACS